MKITFLGETQDPLSTPSIQGNKNGLTSFPSLAGTGSVYTIEQVDGFNPTQLAAIMQFETDALADVGTKMTPAAITQLMVDVGAITGEATAQVTAIMSLIVPLIGTKISLLTGITTGLAIYSLLAKTTNT